MNGPSSSPAERFFLEGVAHQQARRLAEAEAAYRRAIAAAPGFADAQCNLGAVLKDMGRLDEAADALAEAVRIAPGHARAWFGLGATRSQQGRPDEALASFEKSAAADPAFAKAREALALAFAHQGRSADAEREIRRAIALDPAAATAHSILADVLFRQRRLAEAMDSYRRASELQPGNLRFAEAVLFGQNYFPDVPAAQRLADAKRYGEAAARAAQRPFTAWPATANTGKLRLGFVSGDLRDHPVGYFIEGLVREIDRERFELHAYATTPRESELTQRIRPRFASWQSIAGLADEAAARRIHDDGIHVLFDLAGHTVHNRLPLFAWKPAPMQVAWLGYFATTGVAQVDYLLADAHVVPPDEEWHFTERILRLPDCYLCFTPPPLAIDVAPPPVLASGAPTFGCFNNLDKLNDGVVALWARLLAAIPGSHLFLKAKQLGDAAVDGSVRARFAAHGIEPSRLVLEGPSPRADYLRAYGRIDIALDPFPYPGGTTTAEALWMGVPVLTLRGDRFLSHAGESILHAAGLADWIANDTDDYLAKAAAFARDVPSLAALRARLRDQVLRSPLCDARRFARHFERAILHAWASRHQMSDCHDQPAS